MDDDGTAVEQSEPARHLVSRPYPTLPGGRPVRPWAVRALGGATAAVFSLGVATALIASGPDGVDGLDRVDRSPLSGAAEGENALGSTEPPGLDGPLVGPLELPNPTGPISIGPDTGDDPPRRGATAGGPSSPGTARSTAAGTAAPFASSPPPPATPAPTAPPGPGPQGPVAPPAPPAPPIPVDEPLVNLRIDDDTAVAIGGGCTGVEALGLGVGCEPPADSSLGLPGL